MMTVTRQSILEQIQQTIDAAPELSRQAALGYWGGNSSELAVAAKANAAKRQQLTEMLRQGDLYGWGGDQNGGLLNSQTSNAFGAVPTVDTSNRFEAGLSDAETRLRALLDNPDSIQQSAAYKFRVGQGQEALQRSLGAKGLLNSGNRLMELTKYGQDMGSQEYENQFGRLGNLLTNYSGSWIGDKNANTSRYAAQANAWNTAQGNADANRYRMGNLAWEMSKPQSGSSTGFRTQTRLPTGWGGGFGGFQEIGGGVY
jgi:hypothetical protein